MRSAWSRRLRGARRWGGVRGAVVLAGLLYASASHAQLQFDLTGTWRAGATAIEVSVESWGTDCGTRPSSTHSNGGGLVTIAQQGQSLLLHGRDQDIRTDACWSRNPAMKRSAASYSDGLWMIRCRTASNDPRAELGIYTLTLQGADTLLYKDVSHYDWALNESKCVATFTTTQTLTRVTPAAQSVAEVVPGGPDTSNAEPAATGVCRPGPAVNVSLRPKQATVEVGERVCFKARVTDANGCALPSPNVTWQLSHPKALRGSLSAGCFSAADAEGEFRVIAKSGSAQGEAAVVVTRMDLSALIARRMESSGLNGVDELEEEPAEVAVDTAPKAVARIATHTAPAEASGSRLWLVVSFGIVALGLTVVGFWMSRREPSPKRADVARSPSASPNAQAAPAPSSQRPGEVWICPACRIGYPAEQTTCPKDGEKLVPYAEFTQLKRKQQAHDKRCPRCGKTYPASAAFCGEDGTGLVESS